VREATTTRVGIGRRRQVCHRNLDPPGLITDQGVARFSQYREPAISAVPFPSIPCSGSARRRYFEPLADDRLVVGAHNSM
jgi:hypothetical protein